MSMLNLRWPLVAALGLGIGFPSPAGPPGDVAGLPRVTARLDDSFLLPDSVRALLTWVSDLVVDGEGSIYLSDARLPAILNLGPTGDFRRLIGRRGSGPGEFQSVYALGFYRDSLWALDPGQVRLTFFPLEGRGASTIPYGIYASSRENRGPTSVRGIPTAVLPDGSLLVQETLRDSASQRKPGKELLLRAERSLEVVDTLARMPQDHSRMGFVYQSGEVHYVQPFGDDPLYAVSADGRIVVTVTREAAQNGGPGRFLVTAWRGGSERAFTREITYRPRALTQSMVDSLVRTLVSRVADARTPITADSIRRHLYRPEFRPPVETVRVARDGAIWLLVHFDDSPDGAAEWLQLSPRGFELTRVSLPADFRLMEADGRMLWGVRPDAMEVPQVVRYLVPSRAG